MKYIIIYALLFIPSLAQAQNDPYGVNTLEDEGVNLGTRNFEGTIAGIINIVLGFLGILATVFIVYGGFKYMTSGGNAAEADTGKKAAMAGLVGLFIVLSAYAIARYVLDVYTDEINP